MAAAQQRIGQRRRGEIQDARAGWKRVDHLRQLIKRTAAPRSIPHTCDQGVGRFQDRDRHRDRDRCIQYAGCPTRVFFNQPLHHDGRYGNGDEHRSQHVAEDFLEHRKQQAHSQQNESQIDEQPFVLVALRLSPQDRRQGRE